jgi:hypothetical protein
MEGKLDGVIGALILAEREAKMRAGEAAAVAG